MNRNLQLLQSLYSTTSGKYLKFKHRLDKALQSGRFHKLNKRKQSSLISRLKKLFERLKSLQAQLRIAGAGAALALTISVSSSVHAQNSLGPFERNDSANPFPPPISVYRPQPAIVDIDNDGDLDVFIGNHYGHIQFFRNDSPPNSVTRFTEVTGSENPFDGIDIGYDAALSFIDIGNDGDFDALLGDQTAETFYYENTGSPTNPAFTERTGVSNPFNGFDGAGSIYGFGNAIPVFVDLDEDTDMDLVLGSSYVNADGTPISAVEYYENNGGVFTGVSNHPLEDALGYFNRTTAAFADMDGDGDLDAFVGTSGYSIRSFEQDDAGIFTEVYGTWDPVLETGNPFNNISFSKYSAPAAADFDGDGDIDFIVGTRSSYCYSCPENSNIRYIENTDGDFTLEVKNELNISPFGGVDVGKEAAPVFFDIDGDGDLDAILGAKYSNPDIYVYINENGKFFGDPENPLVDVIQDLDEFKRDVIPVFIDIDNDEDSDLFVCIGQEVAFFRNTGGTFVSESTLFPTLNSSNSYELSLAFIDMDDDGDFDALFGNSRYASDQIFYFQNTGSATSPTFTQTTPPEPFSSGNFFEDNPNFLAVDLDNDGDTDLVVTETYYNGWYGDSDAARTWLFENNGDGTFLEPESPFIIEQTPLSFTSFADIDGDGDLDSFVGSGYSFDYEQNGKVFFYENANPPPETTVNTSVRTVSGGSATIIDPELTISDSDGDDIVLATVAISDFEAGSEVLDFDDGIAGEHGIDGIFNDESGILTLSGRATSDDYQALLRSVTLNFTGAVPGGRISKPSRTLDLAQEITFQVRDTDFTLTTVSVVSINIIPGSEIVIFNAVSPSEEGGGNDFFKIENIEALYPENKVTILNRWGDVVFEVSGYNNGDESKRFNGRDDNGKDLSTGTYFYKIEVGSKSVTGYLSLRR